nr:hypothetical protein VCHA53O474_20450 [Vibrio chagasii]
MMLTYSLFSSASLRNVITTQEVFSDEFSDTDQSRTFAVVPRSRTENLTATVGEDGRR